MRPGLALIAKGPYSSMEKNASFGWRLDSIDRMQSELLLIGWIVRCQYDLRFAPLITGRLNHFSNKGCADLLAIVLQDSAKKRFGPRCPVDAMVGRWLVKQGEHSTLQIPIVNFAVRLSLRGEHDFGTPAIKLVLVFTHEAFADAQKIANRLFGNLSVAR